MIGNRIFLSSDKSLGLIWTIIEIWWCFRYSSWKITWEEYFNIPPTWVFMTRHQFQRFREGLMNHATMCLQYNITPTKYLPYSPSWGFHIFTYEYLIYGFVRKHNTSEISVVEQNQRLCPREFSMYSIEDMERKTYPHILGKVFWFNIKLYIYTAGWRHVEIFVEVVLVGVCATGWHPGHIGFTPLISSL